MGQTTEGRRFLSELIGPRNVLQLRVVNRARTWGRCVGECGGTRWGLNEFGEGEQGGGGWGIYRGRG